VTLTRTTIGRDFEETACSHLVGAGYRLVTRNYRAPGGEIDIIAWDGEVLCFVEVRGRAEDDHGDPLETITPAKVGRIIRAARAYLETLPQPWPAMRFDVVGLTGNPPGAVRLIRDAFDDSRVGA
jgi:putative endonuclease